MTTQQSQQAEAMISRAYAPEEPPPVRPTPGEIRRDLERQQAKMDALYACPSLPTRVRLTWTASPWLYVPGWLLVAVLVGGMVVGCGRAWGWLR